MGMLQCTYIYTVYTARTPHSCVLTKFDHLSYTVGIIMGCIGPVSLQYTIHVHCCEHVTG